jgi:integrase
VFTICALKEQPLSRELLMEYRAAVIEKNLSASTVNVRLSAVGKLVSEARRNGWLNSEQAAQRADVPNIRQLKGKRDYCILALLVGCALRRRELAGLELEDIQQREGRWVISDLCGKGGRVRTVAIPIWVKQGIDAWTAAAKLGSGRLLRPVLKSGRLVGDELSDWAVWSVVESSAKEIGIQHFGAHDPKRTYAKLCR